MAVLIARVIALVVLCLGVGGISAFQIPSVPSHATGLSRTRQGGSLHDIKYSVQHHAGMLNMDELTHLLDVECEEDFLLLRVATEDGADAALQHHLTVTAGNPILSGSAVWRCHTDPTASEPTPIYRRVKAVTRITTAPAFSTLLVETQDLQLWEMFHSAEVSIKHRTGHALHHGSSAPEAMARGLRAAAEKDPETPDEAAFRASPNAIPAFPGISPAKEAMGVEHPLPQHRRQLWDADAEDVKAWSSEAGPDLVHARLLESTQVRNIDCSLDSYLDDDRCKVEVKDPYGFARIGWNWDFEDRKILKKDVTLNEMAGDLNKATKHAQGLVNAALKKRGWKMSTCWDEGADSKLCDVTKAVMGAIKCENCYAYAFSGYDFKLNVKATKCNRVDWENFCPKLMELSFMAHFEYGYSIRFKIDLWEHPMRWRKDWNLFHRLLFGEGGKWVMVGKVPVHVNAAFGMRVGMELGLRINGFFATRTYQNAKRHEAGFRYIEDGEKWAGAKTFDVDQPVGKKEKVVADDMRVTLWMKPEVCFYGEMRVYFVLPITVMMCGQFLVTGTLPDPTNKCSRPTLLRHKDPLELLLTADLSFQIALDVRVDIKDEDPLKIMREKMVELFDKEFSPLTASNYLGEKPPSVSVYSHPVGYDGLVLSNQRKRLLAHTSLADNATAWQSDLSGSDSTPFAQAEAWAESLPPGALRGMLPGPLGLELSQPGLLHERGGGLAPSHAPGQGALWHRVAPRRLSDEALAHVPLERENIRVLDADGVEVDAVPGEVLPWEAPKATRRKISHRFISADSLRHAVLHRQLRDIAAGRQEPVLVRDVCLPVTGQSRSGHAQAAVYSAHAGGMPRDQAQRTADTLQAAYGTALGGRVPDPRVSIRVLEAGDREFEDSLNDMSGLARQLHELAGNGDAGLHTLHDGDHLVAIELVGSVSSARTLHRLRLEHVRHQRDYAVNQHAPLVLNASNAIVTAHGRALGQTLVELRDASEEALQDPFSTARQLSAAHAALAVSKHDGLLTRVKRNLQSTKCKGSEEDCAMVEKLRGDYTNWKRDNPGLAKVKVTQKTTAKDDSGERNGAIGKLLDLIKKNKWFQKRLKSSGIASKLSYSKAWWLMYPRTVAWQCLGPIPVPGSSGWLHPPLKNELGVVTHRVESFDKVPARYDSSLKFSYWTDPQWANKNNDGQTVFETDLSQRASARHSWHKSGPFAATAANRKTENGKEYIDAVPSPKKYARLPVYDRCGVMRHELWIANTLRKAGEDMYHSFIRTVPLSCSKTGPSAEGHKGQDSTCEYWQQSSKTAMVTRVKTLASPGSINDPSTFATLSTLFSPLRKLEPGLVHVATMPIGAGSTIKTATGSSLPGSPADHAAGGRTLYKLDIPDDTLRFYVTSHTTVWDQTSSTKQVIGKVNLYLSLEPFDDTSSHNLATSEWTSHRSLAPASWNSEAASRRIVHVSGVNDVVKAARSGSVSAMTVCMEGHSFHAPGGGKWNLLTFITPNVELCQAAVGMNLVRGMLLNKPITVTAKQRCMDNSKTHALLQPVISDRAIGLFVTTSEVRGDLDVYYSNTPLTTAFSSAVANMDSFVSGKKKKQSMRWNEPHTVPVPGRKHTAQITMSGSDRMWVPCLEETMVDEEASPAGVPTPWAQRCRDVNFDGYFGAYLLPDPSRKNKVGEDFRGSVTVSEVLPMHAGRPQRVTAVRGRRRYFAVPIPVDAKRIVVHATHLPIGVCDTKPQLSSSSPPSDDLWLAQELLVDALGLRPVQFTPSGTWSDPKYQGGGKDTGQLVADLRAARAGLTGSSEVIDNDVWAELCKQRLDGRTVNKAPASAAQTRVKVLDGKLRKHAEVTVAANSKVEVAEEEGFAPHAGRGLGPEGQYVELYAAGLSADPKDAVGNGKVRGLSDTSAATEPVEDGEPGEAQRLRFIFLEVEAVGRWMTYSTITVYPIASVKPGVLQRFSMPLDSALFFDAPLSPRVITAGGIAAAYIPTAPAQEMVGKPYAAAMAAAEVHPRLFASYAYTPLWRLPSEFSTKTDSADIAFLRSKYLPVETPATDAMSACKPARVPPTAAKTVEEPTDDGSAVQSCALTQSKSAIRTRHEGRSLAPTMALLSFHALSAEGASKAAEDADPAPAGTTDGGVAGNPLGDDGSGVPPPGYSSTEAPRTRVEDRSLFVADMTLKWATLQAIGDSHCARTYLPSQSYAFYSGRLPTWSRGVCIKTNPVRGLYAGDPNIMLRISTRASTQLFPLPTMEDDPANNLDSVSGTAASTVTVVPAGSNDTNPVLPEALRVAGGDQITPGTQATAQASGDANSTAIAGRQPIDKLNVYWMELQRTYRAGAAAFKAGNPSADSFPVLSGALQALFPVSGPLVDGVTKVGGAPDPNLGVSKEIISARVHSAKTGADTALMWEGQALRPTDLENRLVYDDIKDLPLGVKEYSATYTATIEEASAEGGMHKVSVTPLTSWPMKVTSDLVPQSGQVLPSAAALQRGGVSITFESSCDTFADDVVSNPFMRAALVRGLASNYTHAAKYLNEKSVKNFEWLRTRPHPTLNGIDVLLGSPSDPVKEVGDWNYVGNKYSGHTLNIDMFLPNATLNATAYQNITRPPDIPQDGEGESEWEEPVGSILEQARERLKALSPKQVAELPAGLQAFLASGPSEQRKTIAATGGIPRDLLMTWVREVSRAPVWDTAVVPLLYVAAVEDMETFLSATNALYAEDMPLNGAQGSGKDIRGLDRGVQYVGGPFVPGPSPPTTIPASWPANTLVHGPGGAVRFSPTSAFSDWCGGRGFACGPFPVSAGQASKDHTTTTVTPAAMELIRQSWAHTSAAGTHRTARPWLLTNGYSTPLREFSSVVAAQTELTKCSGGSPASYCSWTESQTEAGLRIEVETLAGKVAEAWEGVALTVNQFSALVVFAYDVGPAAWTSVDSANAGMNGENWSGFCPRLRTFIQGSPASPGCWDEAAVQRRHMECVLFWTPPGEDPPLPSFYEPAVPTATYDPSKTFRGFTSAVPKADPRTDTNSWWSYPGLPNGLVDPAFTNSKCSARRLLQLEGPSTALFEHEDGTHLVITEHGAAAAESELVAILEERPSRALRLESDAEVFSAGPAIGIHTANAVVAMREAEKLHPSPAQREQSPHARALARALSTCTVGGWSEWSVCSVSCGTGISSRSRLVTSSPPGSSSTTAVGGPCPALVETRTCSTGAQCSRGPSYTPHEQEAFLSHGGGVTRPLKPISTADHCGGRGDRCSPGGHAATTTLSLLSTTPVGMALLEHFEGGDAGGSTVQSRLVPYHGAYDPPGVVSVGFGHVVEGAGTVAEAASILGASPISMDRARAFLRADVQDAERCVRTHLPHGVALNANQFSALVSFVLSTDCSTLAERRMSDLRSALVQGRYDEVCSLMRREAAAYSGLPSASISTTTVAVAGATPSSTPAEIHVSSALIQRRHAECILFWTPVGEVVDGSHPLANMASLPTAFDPTLAMFGPPAPAYWTVHTDSTAGALSSGPPMDPASLAYADREAAGAAPSRRSLAGSAEADLVEREAAQVFQRPAFWYDEQHVVRARRAQSETQALDDECGDKKVARVFKPSVATANGDEGGVIKEAGQCSHSETVRTSKSEADAGSTVGGVPHVPVFKRLSPYKVSITLPPIPWYKLPPGSAELITPVVPGEVLSSGVTSPVLGELLLKAPPVPQEPSLLEQAQAQFADAVALVARCRNAGVVSAGPPQSLSPAKLGVTIDTQGRVVAPVLHPDVHAGRAGATTLHGFTPLAGPFPPPVGNTSTFLQYAESRRWGTGLHDLLKRSAAARTNTVEDDTTTPQALAPAPGTSGGFSRDPLPPQMVELCARNPATCGGQVSLQILSLFMCKEGGPFHSMQLLVDRGLARLTSEAKVVPYAQRAVLQALRRKVELTRAAVGYSANLTIAAGLRTPITQHFLYTWQGKGGTGNDNSAVELPGLSMFESGAAVVLGDSPLTASGASVRITLGDGSKKRVKTWADVMPLSLGDYDYQWEVNHAQPFAPSKVDGEAMSWQVWVLPGVDGRGAATGITALPSNTMLKAFQMLWNANVGMEDPSVVLRVSGRMDGPTQQALAATPADGFPIGANCAFWPSVAVEDQKTQQACNTAVVRAAMWFLENFVKKLPQPCPGQQVIHQSHEHAECVRTMQENGSPLTYTALEACGPTSNPCKKQDVDVSSISSGALPGPDGELEAYNATTGVWEPLGDAAPVPVEPPISMVVEPTVRHLYSGKWASLPEPWRLPPKDSDLRHVACDVPALSRFNAHITDDLLCLDQGALARVNPPSGVGLHGRAAEAPFLQRPAAQALMHATSAYRQLVKDAMQDAALEERAFELNVTVANMSAADRNIAVSIADEMYADWNPILMNVTHMWRPLLEHSVLSAHESCGTVDDSKKTPKEERIHSVGRVSMAFGTTMLVLNTTLDAGYARALQRSGWVLEGTLVEPGQIQPPPGGWSTEESEYLAQHPLTQEYIDAGLSVLRYKGGPTCGGQTATKGWKDVRRLTVLAYQRRWNADLPRLVNSHRVSGGVTEGIAEDGLWGPETSDRLLRVPLHTGLLRSGSCACLPKARRGRVQSLDRANGGCTITKPAAYFSKKEIVLDDDGAGVVCEALLQYEAKCQAFAMWGYVDARLFSIAAGDKPGKEGYYGNAIDVTDTCSDDLEGVGLAPAVREGGQDGPCSDYVVASDAL